MQGKRRQRLAPTAAALGGAGAGVSLVLLLLVVIPKSEEDFYLGKSLRFYAEALERGDEDLQDTAVAALRKIGAEHSGSLPLLRSVVNSEPAKVRLAVIEALGRLGDVAIPVLEEKLFDADERVARAAVAALARIGGDAVPILIGLLPDPRGKVAKAAAEQLRELGAQAAAAAPALVGVLRLEELEPEAGQFQGSTVAAALERMGRPAVPYILEVLEKSSVGYELTRTMLEILGDIGAEAEAAIPLLVDLVREQVAAGEDAGHPDEMRQEAWQLMESACGSLERIGMDAAAGLTELMRQHTSRRLRLACLRALDRIARASVDEVEGEAASVGAGGVRASPRGAAANRPQQTLSGRSRLTRRPRVLDALVPTLVEIIERGDEELRLEAAKLAGRIGPPAGATASAIFHRLVESAGESLPKWTAGLSPPPQVVKYTGRAPLAYDRSRTELELYFHALLRLEGAGLPRLARSALLDQLPGRYLALALLSGLGPSLEGSARHLARGVLVASLPDPDDVAKIWAASALGRAGSARDADILLRLYLDLVAGAGADHYMGRDARIEQIVRVFIEALDALGQKALPAVIRALEHEDWRVRYLALEALSSSSVPVAELAVEVLEAEVAALRRVLEDERNLLRLRPPSPEESGTDRRLGRRSFEKVLWHKALEILAALGAKARHAVPTLLGCLDDPDLRQPALTALAALEGAAAAATPVLFEHLVDAARERVAALELSRREAFPAAASIFQKIGPEALPALLGATRDVDAYTRYWALALAAEVATGGKLAVLSRSSRRRAPVRRLSTRSSRMRRPRPPPPASKEDAQASLAPAVEVVLALTEDEDTDVRALAVTVLGQVDLWLDDTPLAVLERVRSRLIAMLERGLERGFERGFEDEGGGLGGALGRDAAASGSEETLAVVRTLGGLGEKGAEAAVPLVRRLVRTMEHLRQKAALERSSRGLRFRVHRAPEDAAEEKKKATAAQHPPPDARRLRPVSTRAPRLAPRPPSTTRRRAAITARRPRSPRRPMVEYLDSTETRLFQTLVETIPKLGAGGVGALLETLDAPDAAADVRYLMAYLIDEISPPVDRVLASLSRALDTDDELVRDKVIAVLGKYGPGAAGALDALARSIRKAGRETVAGETAALRQQKKALVKRLFGVVEGIGSAAIPHVVELLGDEAPQVRYMAVRTLVGLEAPVSVVAPALRDLLSEAEPAIRYYADWALERLRRISAQDR